STSLPVTPYALGRWRPFVELVMWLLIFFVLGLPLVGLVMTSLVSGYGVILSPATATLENFKFVLFDHVAARRGFLSSLTLSAGAAVFAVFVAVPVGEVIAWGTQRWVTALTLTGELAYALPGVVLAIASLLLFLKPIAILNIQIYNTLWIILYAYLA